MNQYEHIKQTLEEILRRMGVSFDGVSLVESETEAAFVIKSAESKLLIGARGAHISALNHLVKRIASKHATDPSQTIDFYIDVNDYHEKLLRDIKNKATILAERARSFKTNVEMDPMSSYERMVIHTFFEGVSDIKTESVGTGDSRRVVLKYIGE